MTTTSQLVRNAFEWQPGRSRDEVWLAPGTLLLLDTIAFFGAPTEATEWAVALLMCIIDNGGTCLPLAEIATMKESGRLPEHLRSLPTTEWVAQLVGPAFGNGRNEVRPLLVHDDRLYFDRFWRLEQAVASALLLPLGHQALTEPPDWGSTLTTIFGDPSPTNLQRVPGEQLFTSRAQVLAGGPGTGKTFTIAKLILALHRSGGDETVIRLCAPTGKAAQRIKESLLTVLAAIAPDDLESLRATVQPTTIHGLLGITPLSARRWSKEPIHADIVIVDEVSMVDVVILNELLQALDDSTRLLLVGDPQQLQSVDVGSVMADIVNAAGPGLPVTTLEVVHRVATTSGGEREELLDFFDAIRTARVDDALDHLQRATTSLTLIPLDDTGASSQPVATLLEPALQRARALVDGATSPDPTPWQAAMSSCMVLTAQHHGPFSRHWWVDQIAQDVGVAVLGAPSTLGTPVLITATDDTIGVLNGDVGLVRAGPDHAPMLEFVRSGTPTEDDHEVQRLRPSVVSHWQPWWAMTIHKSQGSEFDHVVVSVTPGTRLLSRELLYTAVTRARQRVTIIARTVDIENALRTPARRLTGLQQAIEHRRLIGPDIID